MKRFLVGFTVLASIVGLGALCVYFGRDLLGSSTSVQAEAEPAADAPPRDLTPTPIRLAEASDEEPAVSPNPFGGRASSAARSIAVENSSADESAAETLSDESSDIPPAGQIPEVSTERSRSRAELIESRDQPAPNPRYRNKRSRYAERTAAAEEPEAPAGDPSLDQLTPAEPRALVPVPTRQPLDRYGRSLDGDKQPAAKPEVADDTPPAEPQPITRRPRAALDAPSKPTAEEPQAPAASDGTGRPGDPRLSGSQTPTLAIEKTAPPEIQIGKPAKFLIKVRNTGAVAAQGVEVHDVVPQGTQLVNTSPAATRGAGGELVWDLGSLKPGDEQTVELELMPTAEGEVGSVATVHFRAEASVRTMATKPMLAMEVSAPEKVMKGDEVTLKIKISNPGSGAAAGVVLSENVPQGLSHQSGHELELDVGTLKPGESRELQLGLTAAAAGMVTNVILARGEGNLQTEVQTELEVIAPQLEVSMAGPKRRYLERNATHNISVSNPGTASAKDIDLVAVLPRELKFVEANNGGRFDAATHSVYWSLEELPPQETGTVTLTTLPLAAGDAKLLIKSTAKQNLADQREEVVTIDGLAALNFQLSDVNDPIEVNAQTRYEVRVTNQGSKAANNVRLVALLPDEMKGISAEGPVRYRIEGQRVVFEPLKQLAPKADTTFTITAQALQAGDLRLQVQIATDEIREPITKEESTRVYGDE